MFDLGQAIVVCLRHGRAPEQEHDMMLMTI
jgi:hypothetical protein